MKEIIKLIEEFVKERNWEQFHTGENLAKSITIEANEVLELFQWQSETTKIEDLKDEIADVLIYSIMLANNYNFDIKDIIISKIKKNKEKYKIKDSFGSSKKYTEYK